MSAFAISTAGLNAAQARFTRASADLVQSVSNPGADEPSGALVEMSEAKIAFKANAAVLRAQDDMMGALLDVLA